MRSKHRLVLLAIVSSIAPLTALRADTITVSGIVTQSVEDGTGPAINNPDLNLVADGDSFDILASFDGSVASGIHDLTGLNIIFRGVSSDVVERGFNSGSLTVAQSGGAIQFSLLGCLRTGSGCGQGNELSLTFMIPAGQLNDQHVAAGGIPGLTPLDLLEDDGVTDIHGSVNSYSRTAANPTPEAGTFVLMGSALLTVSLIGRRQRFKDTSFPEDASQCQRRL